MTGESLRKKLAEPSDDAARVALGSAIERALQLAGMTKVQAAQEMGYGENQAPVSRWIAGIETPQFAKLFAVKQLRQPLVIALAELADGIEIVTQLTVRRRA